MDKESLDQLRRLADKADNFCHSALLPLSSALHFEGLLGGMLAVRDELRAIYVAEAKEDPWVSNDEPKKESHENL